MICAAALVASYLMGAIPFGVIMGKLTRGIDIRDFGSGNIGFTNAYRTLGKGPASLVLALDIGKGFFAVFLCRSLGLNDYCIVAGALTGVLGHSFSVFLRFKGGKAVATSLGVIIGLCPVIAAITFGTWVVLVALFRYVCVASIVAAISVPAEMILWRSLKVPPAYQALACVAATGIVLKHIPNMKRLMNGTEPKFGQKVDIGEEKDRKDNE